MFIFTTAIIIKISFNRIFSCSLRAFLLQVFKHAIVLSNPRICRSFVAYFHVTQWMVMSKLFQTVGPIFVLRILQLLGLTFYNPYYCFFIKNQIWFINQNSQLESNVLFLAWVLKWNNLTRVRLHIINLVENLYYWSCNQNM